jgi:hypothetical protein
MGAGQLMAYSQNRVGELEKKVERLTRLMHRIMAGSHGGVYYPLTNRDATDDQIEAVYAYLDGVALDIERGEPPTAEEFVAGIRERVPQLGDDEQAYGVVASYCYREPHYRALYHHLKRAGLPYLDPRIEGVVASEEIERPEE